MTRRIRTFTLAAALAVPFSLASADGASPAGHWEGAIAIPSGELPFEVDIAVDERGALVGTFTNPSEQLVGYPLSKVSVDGSKVTIEINTGGDSNGQRFVGDLSADGQTLSGELLVSVYGLPFSFRRTGEPEIAVPPTSPTIDAALAKDWQATLAIGASSLPVRLSMRNNADGTASGSWASGSGVATPLRIAHEGGMVTLTSTVAPASFVGALSADGNEIAGTLTSGALQQAVTFTAGVK
jgi:hypothetical protein